MKYLIYFIVLLTCIQHLHAQQNLIGNHYYTIANEVEVFGSTQSGREKDTAKSFRMNLGTKFTVNGITSTGDLIVTFWPFAQDNVQFQLANVVALASDNADEVHAELEAAQRMNDVTNVNQKLKEYTEASADLDKLMTKANKERDIAKQMAKDAAQEAVHLSAQAKTKKDKAKAVAAMAYAKKMADEVPTDPNDININAPGVVSYTKRFTTIGYWANQENFVIELKTFNTSCKQYYGHSVSFNFGAMTLPIKMRFGDNNKNTTKGFQFEENLNLGFTLGPKWQLKGTHDQSVNLLGGVGVSRVKLDSTSLKNNYPVPTSGEAPAVSTTIGFLYQYEIFQIGIFGGEDFLLEGFYKNWVYRGNPWVGVAIGISLFSPSNNKNGSPSTQP
jgi:hypothetical protein